MQELFIWEQHPNAEKLGLKILQGYLEKSKAISTLEAELDEKASSRLFDWIDHFVLSSSSAFEAVGYEAKDDFYHHPGAQLPRLYIQPSGPEGIAVTVDSIANFLMVRGLNRQIEGAPYSPYRRCLVDVTDGVALWVVERRGSLTMEPQDDGGSAYLRALEAWKSRNRLGTDETKEIQAAHALAEELVASIGSGPAAFAALEGERDYWQARNRAGAIQKMRQDGLGLGWANHDHHTFRSTREHFLPLVQLFEALGFHCRERFYAGEEAGWGAQVMEHTEAGLILFLDVDLSPEEVGIDFAHEQLKEASELGTIGLWCALHGNSITSAGMHHLEGQFQFDALKEDLSKLSIGMMDPFSNMEHLRQAFTEGEVWPVDQDRIEMLLKQKKITEEQANQFQFHGAVGSHLENLQRRNGFKGFNQKNVSYIIKKTDPRKMN